MDFPLWNSSCSISCLWILMFVNSDSFALLKEKKKKKAVHDILTVGDSIN